MHSKHPGHILITCMQPYGISQNELARHMGVPPRRINEIVLGKRGITADTAIGLAEVLGIHEHFWLKLQADYELARARQRRQHKPRPPPRAWKPLDDTPLDDEDAPLIGDSVEAFFSRYTGGRHRKGP